MGKVIVIIIGLGLLAGVSSLILDGIPNVNPSPGFLIAIIIILFIVIMLLIALLRLFTSSTSTSHDEWGNGGGGGVDLPPLDINPYGNAKPRDRYPKRKWLTDDDIIQGEVIDEPKYLSVSQRKLETTKEYERRLLPAKTKEKVRR